MSASLSPLPRRTFQELYCEQNGIGTDKFEQHVLRAILYPHARSLGWLIRLFWSGHFIADLELVRAAASVRRMRELQGEAGAFIHHPANTGVLRRVFRLRASSARLHDLVRQTLYPAGGPASGTTAPFGDEARRQG
jgi:hypothetical protein